MEINFENGGELLFNYASVMDETINAMLMGRLSSITGNGRVSDVVEKYLVTGNVLLTVPDDLDKMAFLIVMEYIVATSADIHQDSYDITVEDLTELIPEYGINEVSDKLIESLIDEHVTSMASLCNIMRTDTGENIEYAGMLGWVLTDHDSNEVMLQLGYFKEETKFIGSFPMHDKDSLGNMFEPNYSDESIPTPLVISASSAIFAAHISQGLICSIIIEYLLYTESNRQKVINGIKVLSQFTSSPLDETFINTISNRDWIEHLTAAETIIKNNSNIISFIGYDEDNAILHCIRD